MLKMLCLNNKSVSTYYYYKFYLLGEAIQIVGPGYILIPRAWSGKDGEEKE